MGRGPEPNSESRMERWSTSESLECGVGWPVGITSIRDSLSVGDMGGVIGTMDRESFLANGLSKKLRPLSGRGATTGKEFERGVENMAV